MTAGNCEILSAEVFLSSFAPKVDTTEIDAALAHIDQELQAYQCDASMTDYAIAALCGMLSCAVDSCLIRNVVITREDIFAAPGQVIGALKKAASGEKSPAVKTASIPKNRQDSPTGIQELQD